MIKRSVRRRQVPAVTRALAILRRLGRAPEPLGVNHLARELGLIPSTCLHILRVLSDEGLVAFDPDTKRYSIGLGILPIARSALEQSSFAKLIEPRLTQLSRNFGGTAVATELVDTGHMVVVALSRAQQPFRLHVDLGSRFPALISATGRCHAAFNLVGLPVDQLRARFERLKWDKPPGYRAWRREVEDVRARGLAVDCGNYINGVTILAVPFLDRRGRMTHSLVAIEIAERFEAIGVASVADEMVRIRDAVSHVLVGVSK
jgi:DNA-binding IclR family transcriptional regulator